MSALAGQPGVFVSEPLSAFPPSSLPAYDWVWPNAAARIAQAVTASQVGGVGLQQDIGVTYTLWSVGGIGGGGKWWFGDVLGAFPPRGSRTTFNSASNVNNYGVSNALTGAFTLITSANTSVATRLPRTGLITTSIAGATVFWTQAGGAGFAFADALHYFLFTTELVSANGKWFVGLGLPAGNQDFSTLLNCLGLSRRGGADANVIVVNNDGAGATQGVDLGVAFPAVTAPGAPVLYEAIVRVAAGGASAVLQLQNVNTGATATANRNSDLPAAGTTLHATHYSCNNTDAAPSGLGVSLYNLFQFYP